MPCLGELCVYARTIARSGQSRPNPRPDSARPHRHSRTAWPSYPTQTPSSEQAAARSTCFVPTRPSLLCPVPTRPVPTRPAPTHPKAPGPQSATLASTTQPTPPAPPSSTRPIPGTLRHLCRFNPIRHIPPTAPAPRARTCPAISNSPPRIFRAHRRSARDRNTRRSLRIQFRVPNPNPRQCALGSFPVMSTAVHSSHARSPGVGP